MLVVAQREQLPVAEARAGSPDAWHVLFKRYQLPLYVYAFEMAQNEQTALDIVQETFIQAARHIASLRDNGRFGSWLFSIAHQKCIQHWRKWDRESAGLDQLSDAEAESQESPRDLLLRKEQEAEFFTLLEQLPLPQRSILLLFFVEEFSLAEIAEITAIPTGTVKSRLHYARKALKKLWQTAEALDSFQ